VMFNNYPHLVPRVRISGGIPLLPLHAFMARWRTTLCLHLPVGLRKRRGLFWPSEWH
jgi:hypothetical protein